MGDICVGESVLLGLMAPLVRMRDPLFLRRGGLPPPPPSSSAEPADPEDPDCCMRHRRAGRKTGTPSPSVPLPSLCPLYTTVSQDMSLEEYAVEVPDVVRSEELDLEWGTN